jgi:hypothetical protein
LVVTRVTFLSYASSVARAAVGIDRYVRRVHNTLTADELAPIENAFDATFVGSDPWARRL